MQENPDGGAEGMEDEGEAPVPDHYRSMLEMLLRYAIARKLSGYEARIEGTKIALMLMTRSKGELAKMFTALMETACQALEHDEDFAQMVDGVYKDYVEQKGELE